MTITFTTEEPQPPVPPSIKRTFRFAVVEMLPNGHSYQGRSFRYAEPADLAQLDDTTLAAAGLVRAKPLPGGGLSVTMDDHEHHYVPASLLTEDDPTADGTDGAHPAWWRGCDHGTVQAAKALLRVAQEGQRGEFGCAELREAADVVDGLRCDLADAQRVIGGQRELRLKIERERDEARRDLQASLDCTEAAERERDALRGEVDRLNVSLSSSQQSDVIGAVRVAELHEALGILKELPTHERALERARALVAAESRAARLSELAGRAAAMLRQYYATYEERAALAGELQAARHPLPGSAGSDGRPKHIDFGSLTGWNVVEELLNIGQQRSCPPGNTISHRGAEVLCGLGLIQRRRLVDTMAGDQRDDWVLTNAGGMLLDGIRNYGSREAMKVKPAEPAPTGPLVPCSFCNTTTSYTRDAKPLCTGCDQELYAQPAEPAPIRDEQASRKRSRDEHCLTCGVEPGLPCESEPDVIAAEYHEQAATGGEGPCEPCRAYGHARPCIGCAPPPEASPSGTGPVSPGPYIAERDSETDCWCICDASGEYIASGLYEQDARFLARLANAWHEANRAGGKP